MSDASEYDEYGSCGVRGSDAKVGGKRHHIVMALSVKNIIPKDLRMTIAKFPHCKCDVHDRYIWRRLKGGLRRAGIATTSLNHMGHHFEDPEVNAHIGGTYM